MSVDGHPAALQAFADEVGPIGPVTAVGGRTRWTVGGPVVPGTREVRPPVGVVAVVPEEMVVRVRVGTPVAELAAALAAVGQRVPLPAPGPGSTVGGALAVGHSDVRRPTCGPVRDAVLEATYVSAEGRLVRAGGPTVKNVTGFDLCRALVGSLGTLGLLAEVLLRTRPVPPAAAWWAGAVDPRAVAAALHRPASVLWDGTTTWVLLEGHPADVADEGAACRRAGLAEVGAGPVLPPWRHSSDPARLVDDPPAGRFVAEVGVGTVHTDVAPRPAVVPPELAALHRRLRRSFDPTERLNPGREVLAR